MKTIAKGLLFSLILIFTMASCATYSAMANADSNVKRLNLGMTKEQVISVMGYNYEVINAKEGTFTFGYKSYDGGIYKLLFIDGKLTEWSKKWFKEIYPSSTEAVKSE